MGYLPKLGPHKAKGCLRPDEDAALLACTKIGTDGVPVVPLWRRVYWGFLSREGTREGEATELRWGDVDLKHGGVTLLDENKSDDLRAWALDPSVTEALRAWAKVHPLREEGKTAPPKDARVFVTAEGEALDPAHLPRTLRADLIAAGGQPRERRDRVLDLRPDRPQVERDDQSLQARRAQRLRTRARTPEAARRSAPGIRRCRGSGAHAGRRAEGARLFSRSFSGGAAFSGARRTPSRNPSKLSGEQGIRTLGSFHYT